MALRSEWISDSERFAAIERSWDQLAEHDATPFSRHAWFAAWWEAFGAGRELRICTLWDGDELAAALPLCSHGGRLEAMANAQTPEFRPLARDAEARAGVVDAAARASASELVAEAVPDGDPALAALVSGARGAGRLVAVELQHVAPAVETSGDWSAYRARMGSAWRETERRRRKLIREHEVAFDLSTTPVDVLGELERGLAVEGSGWKGRAGTAILSSEDMRRFYRSLAVRFAALGEVRFSGLSVDGRLVAFDFALLRQGRYYLLKTGYDEGLRRFSPGLVLRLAVIERCFELGLTSHEFLGDDMPWKRLFATFDRRSHRVRAYRRRPVPMARAGYRRAVRPTLRRVYRPTLGRLRERWHRSRPDQRVTRASR